MSNLPNMTASQIKARAKEKKQLILNFLSSGEVWTTQQVIQILLGCDRRTAARTITQMVQAHLLKTDKECRKIALVGITNHGLALSLNPHANCKEFAVGKVNDSFVNHHIQTQLARLKAQSAGWTEWQAGKLLYTQNESRLKKVPDALAINQQGLKVAVEIELHIKSHKRLAEVVGLYLQQIQQKQHDIVHYITPHPEALKRALERVEFVVINTNRIKMNDTHRARFLISNIDSFPTVFQQ